MASEISYEKNHGKLIDILVVSGGCEILQLVTGGIPMKDFETVG